MTVSSREAIAALGISNFSLAGEPTSEAEFNAQFVKETGVDSDGIATTSTDPEDFCVTWGQVSASFRRS